MKKIFIIAVFVFFIITASVAQNLQRVNTTVNASTWTAIQVPRSNKQCINYAWFMADGQSYIVADDSSGSNSTTIPEGVQISWSCMENPTGTLFYVKSTSGEVVFTVLYD